MNRKLLLALGMVALLALAGCSETPSDQGEGLAEDTGSDVSNVNIGESYWFEVKKTEKNQQELVRARPPVQMGDSLERQNLIRRYEYLNDQNNVHYVYLLSNDGKVISNFVAQGKVSSVNSKLTNDKQIVRIPDCDWHQSSEGSCYRTVESPQLDGSYGTNGAAIFFFTTDGRYVEWNGKYLVSEEPLTVNTPLSLEKQVGDSDNSSGNETSG